MSYYRDYRDDCNCSGDSRIKTNCYHRCKCNNSKNHKLDFSSSSFYQHDIENTPIDRNSNKSDQSQEIKIDNDNTNSSNVLTDKWQTSLPTLKHRVAKIFDKETMSDVHFIVGKESKTRFAAHKFVLSISSPVFEAMFYGVFTKNSDDCNKKVDPEDNMNEIELPDIEPEAFKILLEFLYLDEFNINPEYAIDTLYAANKYEIIPLEIKVVDFLKTTLDPKNAFMFLTQAILFDKKDLMESCWHMIDKHTLLAMQSSCFLDIDIEALKLVLIRDTLRIREASLFSCIDNWAINKCIMENLEVNTKNKLKCLADAIKLIRFPLMTNYEFAKIIEQSLDWLLQRDINNIFIYLATGKKDDIPYSFKPRCCFNDEKYSAKRFKEHKTSWGFSGSSDRICFSTDRSISVIGFVLYGSIDGDSEYEVQIKIIHNETDETIGSNTCWISSGDDPTFTAMFEYPVEISANTQYTACATLKGPDSFYGLNGTQTVNVNVEDESGSAVTVTFKFNDAVGCTNGTSKEWGQIPEILFQV